MTTEANTQEAAKAAAAQIPNPQADPKPRTDSGGVPDTPANRAAIKAGAEAAARKAEGDSKKEPEKKEQAPTRRTLRQAIDAMDKEILKLTRERDEKRKVFMKLQLDIATTEATINSIARIRGEFD